MNKKIRTTQKKRRNLGFTLIELLIAVAIVGILASLAVPAFSGYMTRGKIADATSQLADLRLRMEQFRQDSRSYLSGNACAVGATGSDYFTFACVGTASTFTWTASSAADKGLGAAGDYVYTINQAGAQTTLAFDGADYSGAPKNCWALRSGSC